MEFFLELLRNAVESFEHCNPLAVYKNVLSTFNIVIFINIKCFRLEKTEKLLKLKKKFLSKISQVNMAFISMFNIYKIQIYTNLIVHPPTHFFQIIRF